MEPELEKDAVTKEGTKKIKIEKLFDFEPRGYYVYVHRKMTNGEIFYVGKGKKTNGKTRALSLAGRTELWSRFARKYGVACEIIMDNLTEEYALELERELIAFYGRISVGNGCLTNFMSVGNDNPGAAGLLNPRADKNVYHFVNIFNYESFIGTRYEFEEVKKISIKNIFSNHSLSANGWTTMEIFSTTDIHRLRNPRSGKYSALFDENVYRFYNLETREELNVTRHEFESIVGSKAVDLILGNALTMKDWCLYENKDKWYSTRTDYRTYLFVHKDGRQYLATRNKFKKETNVDVRYLFSVHHKIYEVAGWRVIK